MVRALIISGSPRRGNSDDVAELAKRIFETLGVYAEIIKIRELRFSGCMSCRACVELGRCVVEDDFTNIVAPKLLASDALLIVTPVYFDNVTHLVKKFIDRTWSLRGRLRNIVGGAAVIGRGYGLDTAIVVIHSFMLKHEMVLCHRGARFRAFAAGEALRDERGVRDLERLIHRMVEVAKAVRGGS